MKFLSKKRHRPGVGWTDKYTLITCHPQGGQAGIDHAGVLGRFRGVAVHDAWAPYDTYADADHQLCCAHALRELVAVAGTAPPGAVWCWATQAADVLVAMQHLVTEALTTDTIDTDALNRQIQLYRSAVQIGVSQTSPRSDALMRKHTRSPTGSATGKTTTSASPLTGEYHPTTTAPNATYE